MKIARQMNVVQPADHLVEYGADETTCKRSTSAGLDELIEIALHRLEDEVKLLCGGKEEYVVEGYDIRVKRNGAQGLERKVSKELGRQTIDKRTSISFSF